LASVHRSDYLLLWSRKQFACLLRRYTHTLNGVHDIRLLRKECITQIPRPGDIFIEPFQNIGEHH